MPLKGDNTTMQYFRSLIFIVLLVTLSGQSSAQTGAQQSHAEIHDLVAAFVLAQTRSLPGQVSINVDEIDRRIVRAACPTLEAFLPPGAQLLGSTTIGVRCPVKNGWTLFVPAQIRVSVEMLTTNKTLPLGHVIQADDLSRQKGELVQMGICTDPAQVLGKVLKNSVGAGQVLKLEMLRAPYAVTQGQTVEIKVGGSGFSIHSEGSVMSNAADGEVVQVKTPSGQIVSGTARTGGIVEIRP
jgi:flagella basal body P-ring formation protein FlgA